jgi:hypothetical protein
MLSTGGRRRMLVPEYKLNLLGEAAAGGAQLLGNLLERGGKYVYLLSSVYR